MYNPKIHHRKSIRLKGYDYSSESAYFVTICVKNRECLFGEIVDSEMTLSDMGLISLNNWYDLEKSFPNIYLDEFIIMPNHIHGIIFIRRDLINQIPSENDYKISEPNISDEYNLMLNPKLTLGKIIRYYKAKTTRLIRLNCSEFFQFQRNYHESIIRDEKMLSNIRKYIINNPIKWKTDIENPLNEYSD